MSAFYIPVKVPVRAEATFDEKTSWQAGDLIPGQFVDDGGNFEFDTLREAEAAALRAFPEGSQLVKGGAEEVPTSTPPAPPEPQIADEG